MTQEPKPIGGIGDSIRNLTMSLAKTGYKGSISDLLRKMVAVGKASKGTQNGS